MMNQKLTRFTMALQTKQSFGQIRCNLNLILQWFIKHKSLTFVIKNGLIHLIAWVIFPQHAWSTSKNRAIIFGGQGDIKKRVRE